jgi:hypothetical protein
MSRNEELVFRTIEQIRPDWISNSQLESRTGIEPHQQVFQITRRLMKSGLIDGEQRGREWFFRFHNGPTSGKTSITERQLSRSSGSPADCRIFESLARRLLSAYFGMSLAAGSLPDVPKKFDLVSADGAVVGDAKYFDMVRGTGMPPAKFSVIAEHVWLLEKTNARCKFLVFGNNRRVPTLWLKKYGHLACEVVFLFLDDKGALEVLSDVGGAFSAYQPQPTI